jgi:hypothetical protein
MNRTGSKPKTCEHGVLGAKNCRDCRKKWSRTYYQKHHKACIADATARHAKRRKGMREWIAECKQKSGCRNCGVSNPVVLQYHHRNPRTKEFSIGNVAKRWYSLRIIKKEMKKCDVLCANCHLILHHEKRHSR